MAGNQLDNLQILDGSAPYLVRSLESTDNLQITASVEIQNDLIVTGNTILTNVTSIQTEELRVEDNHILLNDGYVTAVAQTAGLIANYLPIATTDTVNGAFTAGVPATSNPTVITTGSATFAVGQFLLFAGSNSEKNNGLYEVLTHTGTTLTIRGIGTVSTVEDFTEDQFVTDAVVAGTITRINISVIRSGVDGIWETAVGSTTGLSFSDLGSGSGNTLQQAYDVDVDGGDALITTNATDGAVVIAGTEQFRVSATGGLNVDTVADFDVSTFDVQMTGTNGFSIDGTAASNITVAAGNLTVSTVTSGDVAVSSAANVTVDGTGISIDGTAASNLSTTGAPLTISTLTSGTLAVNAVALLDIDAGANIDIDVTGTFDMLSTGAFSVDGTGASNVTATSGNLTISTVTSGSVNITSAGNSTYTVPDPSATALTVTDGTSNYLVVDSTAGAEKIDLPQFANLTGGGAGIILTAGATLAIGDIVVLDTSGEARLADADTGNLIDGTVVGISRNVVTATNPAQIFTVSGSLIPVLFTSAPAGADNGKYVYLSTTAGQATMTPPSGGSNKVIFVIGVLQGGDGADTTPDVIFQPQFISRGAAVS